MRSVPSASADGSNQQLNRLIDPCAHADGPNLHANAAYFFWVNPITAPRAAQTRPAAIMIEPMNDCFALANPPCNCANISLNEASCGMVNNPIANRNEPSAIS